MKKKFPIDNYKTFLYVKAQLEDEIKEDEENLKQELASKIPFGLGNTILNINNQQKGGIKRVLTREVLANGLPVLRRMVHSFFENNKTKMIKVGVSALSGLALSLFVGKKIK